MSDYEIHDERFKTLVIGHAKLERLWTGSRWAEGPVYVPAARHVLWSDIPNNRVLRFVEDDGSVSVFETHCGHQNGHALDGEGRVIACEHGGRRISRLDHDGVWRPLATHFEGRRLNSPNDVVVKSDGSIWLSEPTYGIDGYYEGALAPSEIGAALLFRLDPACGELTAVARDRVRPNGLAFSPNESILHVADTGETHVADTPRVIHAYAVVDGGRSLSTSKTFAVCDNGFFDRFRVDIHGNLWTSSADSVRAYAPDGALIGRVRAPEIEDKGVSPDAERASDRNERFLGAAQIPHPHCRSQRTVDLGERGAGRLLGRVPIDKPALARVADRESDVLGNRHPFDRPEVLVDEGDRLMLAEARRTMPVSLAAIFDRSLGRLHDSAERLDEGRFAGAVFAEQGQDLARAKIE